MNLSSTVLQHRAVNDKKVKGSNMELAIAEIDETFDEATLYERLLPLNNNRILELGCGTGLHTRTIAAAGVGREIVAYEVDTIQFDINLANPVSNIEFKFGGAEEINEADGSFAVAMMFKSLHHVPGDAMARALEEVARVLKPGGYAYISEPIFAGRFNDILQQFHNEQAVRQQAFNAISAAVDLGIFSSVEQIFFNAPAEFADFADFENKVINATHNNHQLDLATLENVRRDFAVHQTADGAFFDVPIRVDLLQKPVAH